MEKHLHPLFQDFVDTDHLYLMEENKLLEIYHDIVKELERQEYDDMQYMEKIFRVWEEIEHRRGLLYTNSIIHDLKNDYREFEKTMHSIIKKEFKDDKRVLHNKSPLLSMIFHYIIFYIKSKFLQAIINYPPKMRDSFQSFI